LVGQSPTVKVTTEFDFPDFPDEVDAGAAQPTTDIESIETNETIAVDLFFICL
jgi:hypothetical protein